LFMSAPARTPLYNAHVAAGGKLVDFAGWEMPVHYGSQVEEHHAVRQASGMFDVSHMTVVDLRGADVRAFLQQLVANDVSKLKAAGKALYTCMLDEQGGVIDDLIIYFMSEDWFRLVVNAATREKDMAWITAQAEGRDLSVTERPELGMIAVQGPEARGKVHGLVSGALAAEAAELKPFSAASEGELFIGRTGYTGEDGYEIILPAADAEGFWNQLVEAGVRPCGLGARDTLRLEAGMNLYGSDMDETTSPLESGLAWTVAMQDDRDFNGRAALQAQKDAGVPRKMVGLVLEGRGVLRGHQKIIVDDQEVGEVTSGTWSPSLEQSIALARVASSTGEQVNVQIRNKQVPARVVKYPFVRNGKPLI
jgi:aminomethyltransferase